MKAFIAKNKKIIIISAVALVAGIVTFIVIRSKKKKAEQAALDEASKTPSSPKPPTSEPGIAGVSFPIKRRTGVDIGMPAEQRVIKNIQTYLNKQMTYQKPIIVNGIYDSLTENYVKTFLKTTTVSYDQYKVIQSKL